MAAVSANELELLQIADAVAREKSIDRGIVIAAMEDAIALANCLDKEDDIASALARYQAEREPEALKVVNAARNRQPQPRPAALEHGLVRRVQRHRAHLIELLEDQALLGRRDPEALVANDDAHVFAIVPRLDLDSTAADHALDPAACVHVGKATIDRTFAQRLGMAYAEHDAFFSS